MVGGFGPELMQSHGNLGGRIPISGEIRGEIIFFDIAVAFPVNPISQILIP
jgi:hypothetical protein